MITRNNPTVVPSQGQRCNKDRGEHKESEPLPIVKGVFNQISEAKRGFSPGDPQPQPYELRDAEEKQNDSDEGAGGSGFPNEVPG